MTPFEPSPIEKLAARTHMPWHWFLLLVGAILILLPMAVVVLDGLVEQFLHEGLWRPLLMAPAVIIYILILLHPMGVSRSRAIEALRRVVVLNDREFDRLVQQASDVDDRLEVIAFLAGALFGFLTNASLLFEVEEPFLRLYLPLVNALMFGLLSWIIVNSLVGTRLEATLLQQPVDIDIFNLSPFEPIARSSLIGSLAFIGGGAISALFLSPQAGNFNVATLVFYGVLILVAVLAFFLGMRHTHRVLASAKDEALRSVQDRINSLFRELAEGGQIMNVDTAAARLDVWLKYEERVKGARTWPYNTAMLRTLFLSTFIPAATWLAKYLLGKLLAG